MDIFPPSAEIFSDLLSPRNAFAGALTFMTISLLFISQKVDSGLLVSKDLGIRHGCFFDGPTILSGVSYLRTGRVALCPLVTQGCLFGNEML
jgi:hypothetical protein